MKLSREKRLRFGIWNDYFVSGSLVDGDWKMREGYTEEKINNFFQSTKYRTYLDEKFYPNLLVIKFSLQSIYLNL